MRKTGAVLERLESSKLVITKFTILLGRKRVVLCEFKGNDWKGNNRARFAVFAFKRRYVWISDHTGNNGVSESSPRFFLQQVEFLLTSTKILSILALV